MQIREFGQNFAGKLRKVFESGEPLTITKYGHSYVSIVRADLWREAEQALAEKRAREAGNEQPSYVAVVAADRWREAERALEEKRAREQSWKQAVPV